MEAEGTIETTEVAQATKATLREQLRQAAVIAALRAPLPSHLALGETLQPHTSVLKEAGLRTDAAGLRAYQGHARALACRVVTGAFPTLEAMLGHEALNALALRLWRQSPPTSGDLGEWGDALPSLIEAHPDLRDWPWLADSARLDWACHLCERAADAELDADSLHLLGSASADTLTLRLKPDLHLVNSTWPIAALWAAHRLPNAEHVAAAEEALATGARGPVLVWRQNHQVQVRCVPESWGSWMAAWLTMQPTSTPTASGSLRASAPSSPLRALGTMLDEAAADFDFTAWLTAALQEGWLWRVVEAGGLASGVAGAAAS